MKKIINNKVYDTETANYIGSWDNGYPGNDFSYLSKSLYRKKTGEYFLYMEGGAFTECAESDGNMTCGGEKIVPLSIEQARKFAFEYLEPYVALAEFEPVPEDETKQGVSFTLPTAIMENIRLYARSSGRKINEVVADALADYLEKNA